ncbi:hypothetical protein Hypma_008161 [Hypsizygus marmoreus]|uniref:Uncharacterized protein n=1 Tax=Hypsizygus marmoreus TaxID=39966 RepID=A0A369JQR5_HYPMA|nr:hypothetical protein Hypma_008161 [Hypsizygus marmoreus]
MTPVVDHALFDLVELLDGNLRQRRTGEQQQGGEDRIRVLHSGALAPAKFIPVAQHCDLGFTNTCGGMFKPDDDFACWVLDSGAEYLMLSTL